jgi:hypothetical protein
LRKNLEQVSQPRFVPIISKIQVYRFTTIPTCSILIQEFLQHSLPDVSATASVSSCTALTLTCVQRPNTHPTLKLNFLTLLSFFLSFALSSLHNTYLTSVVIATRPRAGRPSKRSSILGRSKIFFCSPERPHWFWGQHRPNLFAENKAAGVWSWPLTSGWYRG